MDVRNCRGCGKLFNYLGGGNYLCASCNAALEEKFQVAKTFIRENANVGIAEVAAHAEVRPQQVEKWIREERLVFSSDSSVGIDCEGCGRMIKSGRFCDSCKNSMANKLEDVYKPTTVVAPQVEKKNSKENKMRFL